MLKLSKTQEKIAKQKRVGTSVIKGEVHSGKTSVAVLRMFYLLDHACKAGERVLFVCSNEPAKGNIIDQLKKYHRLENISLFEDEPKGEAVIKSIDDLMEKAADKADVHLNLEICPQIPQQLILELLPKMRKLYPKVRWLKKEQLDFILHELTWINACGYDRFEEYRKAARKGAAIKLPKNGNGRKAIWQLKEQVNEKLRRQGKMTKDQMNLDTLSYLKEDTLRERYRHVIIDDAGELTKVQLECIRLLKSEELGEVLFLMDKNPSHHAFAWLGKGASFKTIGYNMTGHVKHLVKRKVKLQTKKEKAKELTPLEQFMCEQEERHLKQNALEKAVQRSETMIEPEVTYKVKESKLPWYVETYRYINKITGMETVFQRDSSAGETYIDEVKQENVEKLPIYTDIAAGMPIELVDEVSGQFDLPADFLHHRKNTYILHVQGDSMVGANISDGDYVVIQAGNVNNHEIAAVYYNGATTLKHIVQEEDHILLVSENPKYKPIVIEDGDFRVMGKLIGVIKPII